MSDVAAGMQSTIEWYGGALLGVSVARRLGALVARRLPLAFFVLLATSTTWGAMRMPLDAVLEQLRAQGVPIIYTSALAPPDKYIELNAVTLDAVREALPTIGLRLDNRSATWLLVEGPTREATQQRSDAAAEMLPADTTRVETIIVTGTRHRLATIAAEGANVLSSQQLDRVPTLGGDSLRAANLLPGMSSMGISVRPRIRGGLDDETLVLVDGVEILDPYHFANYQSLFSAIDGRLIDDVDVYSGGFPARYGNRMSGVMEINTLSQRQKPPAEIGLSLSSVFANARSADPDGDTTWIASARYGESDLLMERLDLQARRPYYSDGFLRVGHTFSPDTKLYVGGLILNEDIGLTDASERANWSSNSTYLWSRLDESFSDSVTNSTVVSYVSTRRQTRNSNPPGQAASGFLDDTRDTARIALRSDFALATGQSRQEFGIQADWTRTDYDSRALIDRGELGVLFSGEAVTAHDISTIIDGSSAGLYWSGDFPIGPDLSLQPGIRWDVQNYAFGFRGEISPRLGIKWQPATDLTLRLDAGRYYQPDAVYELDTGDGVDHLYKPQRADHYIASAVWQGSAASQLRLDAYEKLYGRASPRYENVFDPFVLLQEVATDRVAIDSTQARAHGIDVEWQDSLSPRTSVIARYSYMDADDQISGRWVPRRWSQRQTVTGIVLWKSDAFSASGSLTWHSGWRTTAPPQNVAVGETIPVATVLNDRFLADYVSVDLGLSATRQVGRSTVTLIANVTNTLNRENAVGVDYHIDENGAVARFSEDHTALLPIVPWVGIVVAF